jgi:hypothetical protein
MRDCLQGRSPSLNCCGRPHEQIVASKRKKQGWPQKAHTTQNGIGSEKQSNGIFFFVSFVHFVAN